MWWGGGGGLGFFFIIVFFLFVVCWGFGLFFGWGDCGITIYYIFIIIIK